MTDFNRKAQEIERNSFDKRQLIQKIEQALNECWNEAIEECSSISTQLACNPKCAVPWIEKGIRALKQ